MWTKDRWNRPGGKQIIRRVVSLGWHGGGSRRVYRHSDLDAVVIEF